MREIPSALLAVESPLPIAVIDDKRQLDVGERDDTLTAALRLREVEAEGFAEWPWFVELVHLFELTFAALRLRGL